MLNPLTTILLDQMVQEEALVGLASSDDTVVTGLASSEEVTISALVKLDATVFLDVDCCSHKKQDSYDPRINLADKTVVGAINQLVGITVEIDKKLNKRTTDGRSAVYAVEGEDQLLIRVEVVEEPDTLVRRNAQGQIFTAAPINYRHAANKGYVDNVAIQVLEDAKNYTDNMIIEHTGIQYEILEENKNG